MKENSLLKLLKVLEHDVAYSCKLQTRYSYQVLPLCGHIHWKFFEQVKDQKAA